MLRFNRKMCIQVPVKHIHCSSPARKLHKWNDGSTSKIRHFAPSQLCFYAQESSPNAFTTPFSRWVPSDICHPPTSHIKKEATAICFQPAGWEGPSSGIPFPPRPADTIAGQGGASYPRVCNSYVHQTAWLQMNAHQNTTLCTSRSSGTSQQKKGELNSKV